MGVLPIETRKILNAFFNTYHYIKVAAFEVVKMHFCCRTGIQGMQISALSDL